MTETPPSSGRIGTFDGRYQYDYIFPRGRSGETLRAWDINDPHILLVIKRPAPQDAPPMRAAQEISIRTERKALERLSGHPALVELRYVGTFRVGGQTHEYIVLDRAHGEIVADLVRELASKGERLPLLETLVIVDELLDLLMVAHDQQVVYNDVDAKHLFWDREHYRLKVIDWGNAVLLDEQGTNQVTRQTDIYQVGELLYFIVTGGKRFESETSPDGEHAVIFGLDAPHVPASLQQVITRATHPNLRKRYATIAELRQQLSEIRRPLQEQRNAILQEIKQKLSTRNSQQELESLAKRLDEARQMDSGYPEVAALQSEIEIQMQRLRTLADIDAALIYLDNGNWYRAMETMMALLDTADEQTAPVIRFIVAAAELLEQRGLNEPPSELASAIHLLEQDEPYQAALLLHNSPTLINQLLAERLTAMIPNVALLRPLLTRLEFDAELLGDGTSAKTTLRQILTKLNTVPEELTLTYVRDIYTYGYHQLESLPIVYAGHERTLDVLARAQEIITYIIKNLDIAAQNVYSQPDKATESLETAYQLDPKQNLFKQLHDYFEEIHLAIEAVANFTPDVEGTNLGDWFNRVIGILSPYAQDLRDEALNEALNTLQTSAELWQQISDALISGHRAATKANLIRLARLIAPYNTKIAQWARQRADVVRTTAQIEQLGPNVELSAKLIEIYQLWDQGKFRDAEYKTEGAFSLTTSVGETQTIKRLSELCKIPIHWLEQEGQTSFERTRRAEQAVVELFTREEQQALEQFTAKMRSEQDYLASLNDDLLESLREYSSISIRILFLHYVFQGMMAIQEHDLDSARFWQNAAQKTLPNVESNILFQILEEQLAGQTLVSQLHNALENATTVSDLLKIRALLNTPLAEKWVPQFQLAIRQLDVAVRHWEDGEFKAARDALDTAISQLEENTNSAIDTDNLRIKLRRLRDTAADLQAAKLRLEEIAHTTKVPPPGQYIPPNETIEETLIGIVSATEQQLGPSHAHQVQQWLSTYRAVKNTYTDETLTKIEKLNDFKNHFANLFINRHPIYRLYQIWREVTQNLAETPPTNTEIGHVAIAQPEVSETEKLDTQPKPRRQRRSNQSPQEPDQPAFIANEPIADVEFTDESTGNDLPYGIIIAVVVVLLGIVAFVGLGGFGSSDDTNKNEGSSNIAVITSPTSTKEVEIAIVPTNTDIPTIVPTASETPISPTATATDLPTATATATPTQTLTPTATVPTATPTQTLPPPIPTQSVPITTDSLTIDVLALLNQSDAGIYSWGQERFIASVGGPWQLYSAEGRQSGPVVVKIEQSDIALLYGTENAANRLMVVEAQMNLALPLPSDAQGIGDGIHFGLGVENTERERVSAEIRIPRANVIEWGIRENDQYRERTSFTDESVTVDIRIERNDDGTVSLYIQDQLLGTSEPNYPIGTPLIPVLYTSRGGIYVIVLDMQFTFAAE